MSGANARFEREAVMMRALAYNIAGLGRVKKLPDQERFVFGSKAKPSVKTPDEIHAVFKQLKARMKGA